MSLFTCGKTSNILDLDGIITQNDFKRSVTQDHGIDEILANEFEYMNQRNRSNSSLDSSPTYLKLFNPSGFCSQKSHEALPGVWSQNELLERQTPVENSCS